ncbi:hypothetical protein L1987_49580 [Smallanthus sonchifolius]|uniref:Uncharacterized protein n=1 Tax=Smallanthus sonchifolius TaxID=185202 RepID=A0ACB9FV57_9ASTR|nr:hypothetical protein L1987_49580 [Smallanthus sonchifolius]
MLKLEFLISMSSSVNLESGETLFFEENRGGCSRSESMADEISPQGLLLVPHGSGSVVVGSHIRGSRLRSSATGYVKVDLLLLVTLGINMLVRAELLLGEEEKQMFHEDCSIKDRRDGNIIRELNALQGT